MLFISMLLHSDCLYVDLNTGLGEKASYLETIPYLSAGWVSSPSTCLKMYWRSHCHCWMKKTKQGDRQRGMSAETNIRDCMLFCEQTSHFGNVPSNKLFLIADVFVVIWVLHDVGNIHNKVDKRLCLLAKEVQEVTKAAVLCDYKHWSWWWNTPYYDSFNKDNMLTCKWLPMNWNI